jgi:hypothetical protein
MTDNTSETKSDPSESSTNSLPVAQGIIFGDKATDSARIVKFTKELSRPTVIFGNNIILHHFKIKVIITVVF